MLQQSKVIKIIFYLVCSQVLASCDGRLHKSYAYDVSLVQAQVGTVHVKMRGTMKNSGDDLSLEQSPYQLLIWVDATESISMPCEVVIQAIKVSDIKEDIYISKEKVSLSFEKKDGVFRASYVGPKIEVEYEELEVSFDLGRRGACENNEKSNRQYAVKMTKNYSEKKLTFWDSLLSI